MIRRRFELGISRVLLGYILGCLALLLLASLLAAPLGLSAGTIRNLEVVMLAFAPVVVALAGWWRARGSGASTRKIAPTDQRSVFHIGPAEVDVASRQIRFAGAAADVQPKVFDLIAYLIHARDRVVTKDELFDAIWPSVVVSEASLTQLIKRARNLFRQHGFDEDVIRTVSRRGYQFNYPVTGADAESAASASPWTTMALPTALTAAAALGLGLAVTGIPLSTSNPGAMTTSGNSLAVLPFSNLTPDPDFAYFSDGLTETVTDSLTRVSGLRVIARDSSFTFRDAEAGFAAIAEQLRVGNIVQGSVQRDGDNLRVSARLVRLSDGAQLWSQAFDRRFDDIFSLHDDIAHALVQQMSGALFAGLDLPAGAPRFTADSSDSEAYRLLLRGQALRRSGSNQDLQAAESWFRQALELKPDYTDALVALAAVLRLRATIGDLPREPGFAEAFALAQRALVIEPDHAGALVETGEIQHRHFWQFAAGADSLQRAIELNPGGASAHAAYSRFLSKAGRQTEAVREARIALDLDPLSTNAASALTIRLIRAGQLEDARQVLDAFKRQHPAHFDIPWLEANWHIRNGSYADALQWTALEELAYLRLSLSAVALHYLGRTDQATAALDELVRTDADGAAFQIAEVYAHWGQAEQAFDWLERAFRQGDPGLVELYSSVNLAPLYADPRFADLAERIGLPPPSSSF